MKIAILGSRGIPNQYGGFEQFAEILSTELVKIGHDVTVYNPHFHSYKKNEFKGVKIIRKYNPEDKVGSAANFLYDFICLKDARTKGFDIFLELGYQSASVSYFFLKPKIGVLITNMDGLEWKRAKWSKPIQRLTKKFEYWGVIKSDFLVADNIGIQQYLYQTYKKKSFYIAYPVDIIDSFKEDLLAQLQAEKKNYFLAIARLEPENNLEIIIEGYIQSGSSKKFLLVGGYQSKYGNYLYQKYKNQIIFLGPIYNKDTLDSLRHYASVYFHGHSVGGTNPSLLEAMASKSFIVAHNNEFNKNVLSDGHFYFSNSSEIASIINEEINNEVRQTLINKNLEKIKSEFDKDIVVNQYLKLFEKALKEK